MATPARTLRHSAQRGIALITALLMTVVLLILIGTLMTSVVNELQLTGLHGQSNEALRAAYAGVEEMQYQFELNDAGFAPGVAPATQTMSWTDDDGKNVSFTATVDPARWTSVLPYYLIHVQGTAGTATRKVDALVAKQPFVAYNMFTIDERNNVGGTVFYASGEQFNGPVYSGGPMNIYYKTGQPPIFNSQVVTAQAPNWVPSAPSSSADWASVISNQGNWQQVSAALTLPTANDSHAVEYAAFNGNPQPSTPPTIPTTQGLYVNGSLVTSGTSGPITSGLFIVGQVTVSSVGSTSLNTEVLTLNTGGGTYIVNVNYGSNTTTVTDGGGTTLATYTGTPSGQQPPGVVGPDGAIFSTGKMNIQGGSTFHGQFTLAVPDGKGLSNPRMEMTGGVGYADTSASSTDELAYWANDIQLNVGSNGNIEIDGAMFTGYYGECNPTCADGTFYNPNCGSTGACTGGTGVLTLRGSLIENIRGKRGTTGSVVSGFTTDGIFDPRLASRPPPFTPTTTQYKVYAICTEDATGNQTCGQ